MSATTYNSTAYPADQNAFYRQPDPLLVPFLRADSESSARAHLDRLIHEHAEPVIARAVRHYARDRRSRGEGDSPDMRAETVRLILTRVTETRQTGKSPIGDFLAYVKVTARHVCWHHCRKARREDPQPLSSSGDYAATTVALPPDSTDVCRFVLRRDLLRTVWGEIRALPTQQRAALLLNFRDADGANALPLLALCAVTTPEDIAKTLGVCPDALSALSDQLPLEDSAVAAQLGITRREVINLRAAARRRLERRLRAWLEPA